MAAGPGTVSEELVNHFRKAVEDGSVRFFQLKITPEEDIVEVSSYNGSGDMEFDFTKIKDKAADEANYFLFKLYNPKEWSIITYVPDTVSVKSKMVMASAKGTVKEKLGYQYFVDEYHATTKDELAWSSYKGAKKQVDSRSSEEVLRDEIHKQEEETRTEQINSRSTGGYHSVTIPLSQSAKDALHKLSNQTANYIELAIDENKTSVSCVNVKNVSSVEELKRELNTAEPRFYLYVTNSVNKLVAFIYCCPDSSASKWRMVYSTAKPTLADQIKKELGSTINLAPKKIEITTADELADALKTENLRNSPSTTAVTSSPRGQFTGRLAPSGGVAASNSAPALGGTVKASNPHTIGGQHPIYALMDQGGHDKPSTKKKIVIPPRGAYNG